MRRLAGAAPARAGSGGNSGRVATRARSGLGAAAGLLLVVAGLLGVSADAQAQDISVTIEAEHESIGAGLEDLKFTLRRGGDTTEELVATVSIDQDRSWLLNRDLSHTVTFEDDAETLSVTGTTTASRVGEVVPAVVTILDNETEVQGTSRGVTVSHTDVSVAEGSNSSYTVVLRSQPTADVTVTITGHSGTNLRLDKTRLTFTTSNWATEQTVQVTASRDGDAVDDKVTLTHTASGGGYDAVSADLPVTVTDITHLQLAAVVETVPEGESIPISATIPMPLDEDVTITVTVEPADSKARPDEFVLSANTTLTIAAGVTESTGEVIFTSLDDFENEGVRYFNAVLTPDHPRVDEDRERFAVVDDDRTIVDLQIAPSKIFENGGEATLGAIKYSLHENVVKMEVSLEPSDRATLSATTLTFQPGAYYANEALTITAVDNAADEPDQTITISASVTEGRGVWTPLPVELTIVDDDNMSPDVALVLTPSQVREGLVSTVTAVTSGPLDDEATITVSASPGHADTRTDDYVLSANARLTIPAGGTRSTGTVTIATVDDSLGDGLDNPLSNIGRSREVTVSGTVTGGGGVADPADQTLTILDDERPVRAALMATPATISEGEVSTITLHAFQPVPADVTVTVTQSSKLDKAQLSTDPVLMIAAGDTESTGVVTLTALQDEDMSHEIVGLKGEPSDDSQFLYVNYGADIYILDDDIESSVVTVSPVPIRIVEGETSTVIARLSQTLSDDVTITISVDESDRNHTATADDFTLSANRMLRIPAGSLSSTDEVTLTASDDEYYGPSRRVALDFSAAGIDQNSVVSHGDLTIFDDEDRPRVTLAVAPAGISENGGQSTVTASLNTIVESDVEVTVTTQPDVAAESDDFTQAGTILTIPADSKISTGTVTITAVDDDLDGPDKNLLVTGAVEVVGMEQSGIVWFPYDEGLTIHDDDEPSFTVTAVPASIAEDGGQTTVTVSTGGVTFASARQITLTLTGTATKGTDYTVGSEALTLTAGETTVETKVTAVQDVVDEQDETVVITAEGTQATVTITDDDEPSFTVTAVPASIAEDGGETTVTVSTGGVTFAEDRQIALTLTGTATKGTDYTVDSEALTLTAGETSVETKVTAVQDVVDEQDETVVITAEGAQATVTITDDDTAGLSLSKSSLSPAEGASESYMVALLTQPTDAVTVTITGHAGTDLTLDKTSLTFTTTNWATEQTVTVTADPDDDTEDDEVTLTHTASGGGYGSVAEEKLTVRVDDTYTAPVVINGAALVLSPESLGLTEGQSTNYRVALAAQPTADVTVTITGQAGTDLTLDETSLTFTTSNWSTAQMVLVTAGEDDDAENDEVTLTHTASGGGYSSATESVTKDLDVTVTDDNKPGLDLSKTSLGPAEGGHESYKVALETQPTAQVKVTITGHEETDLTLDKTSLTFTTSNWSTAQTVRVTASPDGDAVDDEVTLTHTASGGDYGAVSADLPVTVTDITRMQLTAVVETVPEGESRPIRATIPMPLDEDVAITVAVAQTRGTADEYELSANTTLTISAGATESTGEVIFTSVDDFENKYTRYFDATLTPDHPRVDGDTESFRVVDDDRTTVNLEVAPSTIFENGGEATLRAFKYRLHEGVVKMAVSLEPSGRATLSGTTLTFLPGALYATETLTITAVDNAADEPDQTITISASVTEGRGVRTPTPVELTIVDDEGMSPDVALVLTPPLVREGLVSAVTAVASGPLDDEATITVSASPGHADTRTDDFVLSANTVLTIPAGGLRSTGTVIIATVDDPLSAGGRQREVTVSGTVIGGGGVGDPADQTLTILEDDRHLLLDLISTPATITEGEVSTITLRAVQPVPADVIVTVEQTTELDAAELSADPVLMIAAGETESTGVVTLTALQDADMRNEVVLLRGTRSDDSRFVLVNYGAQVLIIDDDFGSATVTVSPVPARVFEGGTSTVVANLSHALSDDVTVTVSVDESDRNHTATADDFTLSANRTLTIPAGSMSSTDVVTLTASDDEYYGPLQTRRVVLDFSATGIDQTQILGLSNWTIYEDEDRPQVTLAVAPASVAENNGQSTVTASLNTIVKSNVEVTVTTQPGVAAESDDFTQTGSLLTISADQKTSTGTVTITAVDDDLDGPDKNLLVTGAVEVVGMEQSGIVWFPYDEGLTIHDDDEPSFTVTAVPASIAEDGGETTVTVSTGGVTFAEDRQITLTLTGTATKGTDYTVDSEALTLTAGETTVETKVTAVPDVVDEQDETVVITAEGAQATVTITDDDESSFTVTAVPASIAEDGGETTVTVSTGGVTFADNRQIALTLTGTATKGTDYTVGSEALTLTAGETTVETKVTAVPDVVDEQDETVVITAEGTQATVTIIDDDTAGLSLSKSSLGPAEGASESYMVALLTQPTDAVTVTITGHSGTDLRLDKTSLTFTTTDWATGQTVRVTAGEDDDAENDEETLEHTASGGGYGSVAEDLPVRVDDDETASAKVTLTVSPSSVSEDAGDTEVEVTGTLDGAPLTSAAEVAVTVGATDDTATEGTDYAMVGELTLTIEAGEASGTTMFTLTPKDDDVDEEDQETLSVTGTMVASSVGEVVPTAVTILDNETELQNTSRGVTVSPTQVSVTEGSDASYTVVLKTEPTADVTVTPSLSTDSSSDVSVSPATLTFTPGNWSTAQTVTVEAGADDDAENDGATVEHEVSGGDYGSNGVTAADVAVTVVDDETASAKVTLTVDPPSVAEAAGETQVEVTGTLDGAPLTSAMEVTVTVGASDDTATEGTDYATVGELSLTIEAGAMSGMTTFTLTPTDDVVDEVDTETLSVTGTTTASGLAVVPTAVTIEDDDEPRFTVTAVPASIAENGGETTVTVSTGGVTFADNRQIALTLTGTATKGTDYTVDSEALTLTAGATTVETKVTAVPDVVDEQDETVVITAEGAQATVTITDDDESRFTVTAVPASIAENGGETTVTVSTGGVTFADNRQIALTLTGTATKGTDYTVDSEALTLTAGATTVETKVTAVPDVVDEQDETVVITAEGAQATVTITDDDESRFTVTAVPASIAENGGETTVTVSTGGVTFADNRQIALTLTGTATKGTDYTVDSEALTLTAGATTVETKVTAVPDVVDEQDETVVITAEGAQATVTITDDDESRFTVTAVPASIAENGGETTVTVSTGGVTFADNRQIALTLTGTATKGTDYTVDSEALTLTAGATTVETKVTAVPDVVDEQDETVVITAEGAQATVTITDDDESRFTVTAVPASIAENGGETTVTVSTGGVTFADNRQIALTLTGTATKGTDYTVDSEALTLTAGATTVETKVTAVPDVVDEQDETVVITAEGAQATVTITDDDESRFTVTAVPASIAENGGETTVTVSTGGVTFADNRQIALTLTGTATKGTDYTVDSEALTLTAGATTVETKVTAVPDVVDEQDETVVITAEGAQATVTITDDDESRFTVTAVPASIAENGGETTVTVSTGGVTFADNRQIALTLTGTATKGTDYTVDSEALTLTAGATTVETKVTAVQDVVDEQDETVVITAEGAQATVTITDDDTAGLSLSKSSLSPAEGASESYMVALLTQPTDAVTVTITGHAGTDLTLDKTSLTFTTTNWATEQTVVVTANQDDDSTDDEVTLTHTASGGGYGSVAEEKLTVTVDDSYTAPVVINGAALVLSPESLGLSEGGSTNYSVALAAQPTAEVTVTITGQAGTDLTLDETSLTFTTSNWSTAQMVLVTAGEDDDAENDEVTLTHTASGGGYSSATESVTKDLDVTVTDDNKPGLDLSKTSLGPAEGGHESYKVALETQPTAQVKVTITGHEETDLTLDKTSLTFTTSNWSTAQTVRVTADEDDDTVDDQEMLTHTASGGDYGSMTKDLPVRVEDNDEPTTEDLVLTVEPVKATVTEGEPVRYRIKMSRRTPGAVVESAYWHKGDFVRNPNSSVVSGINSHLGGCGGLCWVVSYDTLDDVVDEANGRFTVTIRRPDVIKDSNGEDFDQYSHGEAYRVGSPSSATVTILDNDGPGEPPPSSPPIVLAEDARVREGPGAELVFPVTLDRSPVETARIHWETVEVTTSAGATDGVDYVGASGTLEFRSGQTSKTIRVEVLDDSHDEGNEVILLVLSGAENAVIADAVIKGTIENSDPMPQAWLTRFGRVASDHVVDAIAERWRDGEIQTQQTHFTLGGRNVDKQFGRWDGNGGVLESSGAGPGDPALMNSLGLPSGNLRDLLMGSSFFYSRTLEGNGEQPVQPGWLGQWSAWGRTAATRFSGADGALSLNGEVATAILGADARRGRWLMGVTLSRSEGDGVYTHPTAAGGAVGSTLTSLNPYVHYRLSERTSLWGVAGYGLGGLKLTLDGSETAIETDLATAMAAFGGRGVFSVRTSRLGAFELAVVSDVRVNRTESDSVENLMGAAGATSRVRVMLEGSGSMPLATGGVLTPTLEAGLRYDGGDAETGGGLEVGAGLGYAAGALAVEVKGRMLLAHGDTDYEEQGFSGSIRYEPRPDGRGLSINLGSAWGATQSGVQSLWSQQDASGLARGAAMNAGQRFQAELGYGIAGRGRADALWIPFLGAEMGDGGAQSLRMGVTYTSEPNVEAGLELGQVENGQGEREHALLLRGTLRW